MSITLSEIVPARILIIRLGAIRDGLMTVPLAVDAKKLWPNAHLSWVVDGEFGQLLDGHPCIDNVISIQKSCLRNPQGWRSVGQQLQEKRFDLVLDPQSVFKSAMLGLLSKCPLRVGFDRPQAREFASYFLSHKIRPTIRHRIDMYRQLLQPWRETLPGLGQFHLPMNVDAERQVRMSITNIVQDASWVAIYPGAIWPTAVWPLDRFAAVAKYLHEVFQLPCIILWRNQHEHLLAKVIAEQAQSVAHIAPQFNMAELVEACRQSKFVITGDSDLLQIANSVDTNCISLHGPTWADEYGGYRQRSYSIQSPFPIIGNRRVRNGVNSAMQAIELEEVQLYIQRLLRNSTSAARSAA